MTAPASIEHVQSIRGIVCPNLGFRRQLEEFATRYVKLKARPSQLSLPEIFKSGGIASRIRKLKRLNSEGKDKEREREPKAI